MDKMQNLTLKIPGINEFEANDEGIREVELCVVPEGKFAEKGWLKKTTYVGYNADDIENMVTKFDEGHPHYAPFMNEHHGNKAIVEVQSVFQEKGNSSGKQNGLYAKLSVNQEQYDLMKSYGYVSPEVYEDYIDADDNSHGKVFAGFALTDRPRHKRIRKNNFELFYNFETNEEEDMNLQEFEAEKARITAEVEAKYEAQLKEKEDKIAEYELKLFTEKVSSWKNAKLGESYMPANVEKYAEKLLSGAINFEVADEFIAMTEKVETEQVYEQSFADKKDSDSIKNFEAELERMGREDAIKLKGGEIDA